MTSSMAARSLIVFGVSILFLIVLTLFESALLGVADTMERVLSAFLLVLPGIIGVIFGVMSLRRNEMKTGMAIAGILLNALFALFNGFVLSFAG